MGTSSADGVLSVEALGFPWKTFDPFLFCVHHNDGYPAGNERMGPRASLAGRAIGQDFEGRDGWRMYHGQQVPGFPQHPHRGFETVTIMRHGYVDHSDSLGAMARFGPGDVQWLTAGRGIVHSEMFPLLDAEGPNPLELFQIWLNLPAEDKLVEPHFAMLWNEAIPTHTLVDPEGRTTEVTQIAGRLADTEVPSPPPKSWAARSNAEVAIWTIRMEPNARWSPPQASPDLNRAVYFFRGADLSVAGAGIPLGSIAKLRPEVEARIANGAEESELLLLQGRPIGEPAVQG